LELERELVEELEHKQTVAAAHKLSVEVEAEVLVPR
jgi:hypothetical protein